MGKRTSVYLADDLAEAVKASGLPLAGLIRLGVHRAEAGLTLAERMLALPGGAEALRQSIEQGERAMLSGEPMVTLEDAEADAAEQERVLEDFRQREADGTPRKGVRSPQAGSRPAGPVEIIPLEPKGTRPRRRRAGKQEPGPEPERAQRRSRECEHPGVGKKMRCPACGQYNI